jgi:hypothetical protein
MRVFSNQWVATFAGLICFFMIWSAVASFSSAYDIMHSLNPSVEMSDQFKHNGYLSIYLAVTSALICITAGFWGKLKRMFSSNDKTVSP